MKSVSCEKPTPTPEKKTRRGRPRGSVLQDACACRLLLARLIRQFVDGKISAEKLRVSTYALNTLIQAIQGSKPPVGKFLPLAFLIKGSPEDAEHPDYQTPIGDEYEEVPNE